MIRIILVAFIFVFSTSSWARFVISKVSVDCGQTLLCKNYTEKLKNLKKNYSSINVLGREIKLYLLKGDIAEFSYYIRENIDSHELFIQFKIVPIVKDIIFKGGKDIDISRIKKILPLKESSFFKIEKLEDSLKMVRRFLVENGYLSASVTHNLNFDKEDVIVFIEVTLNEPTKIGPISLECDDQEIKKLVNRRFSSIVGRTWSLLDLNNVIKTITDDLFTDGYIFAKVENLTILPSRGQLIVNPHVVIKPGQRYLFSFYGNKIFSRQELLKEIRTIIAKSYRDINSNQLIEAIKNLYKNKGFYHSDVKINVASKPFKGQKILKVYYITLNEGEKLPVSGIHFKGNKGISGDTLKEKILEKAPVLVQRGFYDEKYFLSFVNSLKKYYWENGFVFVEIEGPYGTYSKSNKEISVEYRIIEGIQTHIENISFDGISENMRSKILGILANKIGHPFNAEALNDDLEKIIEWLKSKGFYYAEISNMSEKNFVAYSDGYKKVSLHFKINLKEKILLDKIIIIGNVKTKTIVIERETNLQQNDLITPNKLEEMTAKISSLGLFTSVKISPLDDLNNNGRVNLLISVKEKNFGSVEVTPGFRTDIGFKLGLETSYVNLWGKNRTISAKGQVNQRFNYDTLDKERRANQKKMVEYSLLLHFTEPYFFNVPLNFNTAFSGSRKRFRSFDANIFRTNVSFAKRFFDKFSSSLKYQFETISQENATDPEKDNGSFTIGSLAPSLSLDLRDNRINPQKGAYFNLSGEWANPYFLSQNDDVLEVDFIKVILRNKFYIPIPIGVLALSASLGYQKNLASSPQGRIPSIKAFRLSGIDLIRGFADDEINRLDAGPDVQDVHILDAGYFSSIKIEPRIYVSDTMAVGLFLDAGKIYLNRFKYRGLEYPNKSYPNHFKPFSMRSSVGLSFKYLTPVGSLDFDFGVKLHRRREQGDTPDRELESASRFHVSIGFF